MLYDCTTVSNADSMSLLSCGESYFPCIVLTESSLLMHYSSYSSLPDVYSQIRTHAKRAQLMETVHMRTEPYAFDYFFEQSQRNKSRTEGGRGGEEQSSSAASSSDTD